MVIGVVMAVVVVVLAVVVVLLEVVFVVAESVSCFPCSKVVLRILKS